jgi:carbon monoxide dehydrogenase subunit G
VRGSVRRAVRIQRPAEDVWAFIGDPARLHEWFPGITATTVDGTSRVITTRMGIPMPEEIVTDDQLARRFQYKLLLPAIKEHLSTLDVHDLGDGTCLATYAADADPAAMALIIAGAAGNALENAKQMLENGEDR